MRLRPLLLGLGIASVAHGFARRSVEQIKAGRDPIALDRLRESLRGELHVLERPDGTRIHACTAGSGPTVVLAHGYGVTMHEWNVIWSQLLALGHRCIAFDLRGHGHSTIGAEGLTTTAMAGDYAALLDALDVRDAVLVGHSTGGFLAIKTLLDHPRTSERLRGFAGVATLAGDALRGSPQNALQMPMIQLGVMDWVSRSPTYSWLFGASVCGDEPSPALIRAFNEMFADQRHAELVPLIRALAKESYYARLHEIRVPTVIVCGDKDKTTPRWHAEQLGRGIPGARNVWVEGKGHMLNWEAPEAIVTVVRALHGLA